MADTVSSALSNATNTLTEFTMNGKASFKDFAKSVIEDLIQIQYQQALTGIFGNGSGSGLLGSLLNGKKSVTKFTGVKSLIKNAKGGVYDSPSLSAYSGQIVSQPTLFAFAKGGAPSLGLMGEAGAEAIMPLKRGANGQLGVQATPGGFGGDVNVTVIVNGDGSSQTNAVGDTNNQFAKVLATAVESKVKEVFAKERKQGGMFWNMAQGR